MEQVTTTPFGARPVTAGLVASAARQRMAAPVMPRDKWALLGALRTARRAFGLSDRQLSVLSALLSFHPERTLCCEDGLVVFPSNATLSDRAHGMAESTLRRHLSVLVEAGLIARHDSPNGKRYARRDRAGGIVRAFGFDLRPLLLAAPEIEAAAEDVAEETLRLRLVREEIVLALRDAAKLVAYGTGDAPCPAWAGLSARATEAAKHLRRRLSVAQARALLTEVSALRAAAEDLLPARETPPETPAVETPDPGGTDSHIERHYQSQNPESSDDESLGEDEAPPGLPQLRTVCPEIASYSRNGLDDWDALTRAADRVRPMMGITPDVWTRAQAVMGPKVAAASLACILQRMPGIENPGGYLHTLTRKAERGRYQVAALMRSVPITH